MTRILHVLPDLVPYGAERVVATLASKRSRDRFEVAIASLYDEVPGTLAAPLCREGVRVFHLGKRRGFDPRMFHRIFGVLREFEPDVVHTHNYVLRYVLPPALLNNPPLMVHTIHNVAHLEVDRLGVWLQSRAFSRRVRPVVIAEAAAISFEQVYQSPRPPLIRNGIDVARYSAARSSREDWRARHGFSSGDLLFLCVARFYPQKNHKTLLAAFASGPAKLSNAKLLLAGDGQLRSDIERQARELGIFDRVHFLGRRDDIPEVLAACDVFALASLWEGNPLSVMEAMAAGLPAVVTAVGGVPELVANEKQGIVVPPSDPLALSAALLRLATDSAMRRAMGIAAAKRAQDEFDDRNMVEAYESLYDELLSAPVERDAGDFAPERDIAKRSAA
jgi:glycosyltransferase involved in cell wall biosynthesis